MYRFYINKKLVPSGKNYVHIEGCEYVPSAEDGAYLGIYANAPTAVGEARRMYPGAKGCACCCADAS